MLKIRSIGYWTATAILVLVLLFGGLAQLSHRRGTIEEITRLGYPAYFIVLLGFWKVLGAIALSAPGFPRLKEWAYAGTFFDMTSAAVSHAACGDAAWHVVVTAMFAALTMVSWVLRPQSWILGALFSARSNSMRGPSFARALSHSRRAARHC